MPEPSPKAIVALCGSGAWGVKVTDVNALPAKAILNGRGVEPFSNVTLDELIEVVSIALLKANRIVALSPTLDAPFVGATDVSAGSVVSADEAAATLNACVPASASPFV